MRETECEKGVCGREGAREKERKDIVKSITCVCERERDEEQDTYG